jgi:hypothetical protein
MRLKNKNGEVRMEKMKGGGIAYAFRFTVKHCRGRMRIVTAGSSLHAARRKAALAEGRPLPAIIKEEIRDGRKFAGLRQAGPSG